MSNESVFELELVEKKIQVWRKEVEMVWALNEAINF